MRKIHLQFCSSSDIQSFEERHYVAAMSEQEEQWRTEKSKAVGKKKGHHGQQVHYLIWYHTGEVWENVGAISGGSAVFSTRVRDEFFHLNKENRTKCLNGIIDNTLFRLEKPEFNLASQIVSIWRRQVVKDWEYLYDVRPYGFETFVEFAEIEGDRQRVGCLYRADNWTFVGETSGNTKNHVGVGLTGGRAGGKGAFHRMTVPKKLVFCKWIKPFTEPQICEYKSSWKASTKEGTPEEKVLAKERTNRRKELLKKALTELPEGCILDLRTSSK